MKILNIEACNYVDFPVGGQTTFAKFLLPIFGEDIKLVGITTEKEDPVGVWFRKKINGIEFEYFALSYEKKIINKPFLPRRLKTFLCLKWFKRKILEVDYDVSFTQAPEVVYAVRKWRLKSFCYYMAGTGNPLEISRRFIGRVLAGLYEKFFFPALKGVDTILAASDSENIKATIIRTKGILKEGDIIQFPTKIDTDIFKPGNKHELRDILDLPIAFKIIVTTGRLHWAKGFELMIDAVELFLKDFPDTIFIIIGDGDYRSNIEGIILEKNLTNSIRIIGFQPHTVVANYLSAADIYIMGSYREGWATSLVEAKACGTPIVTTNFSSAKDIVHQGEDGFVLDERDPSIFAQKMEEAINLGIDYIKLKSFSSKSSLNNLKQDLLSILSYSNTRKRNA